jgi:hypothetical protein
LASVSFDLDDRWAYLKTHGDPGWQALPSYLEVLVPRALDALEAFGVEITFFIVGQDAALPRNRETLARVAAAGHELGNHSFHHEQWIEEFSSERIRRELDQAGRAIAEATGREPRGYRGPGFSWNALLLEELARAGYVYDASTFPTWLGPLARAYYLKRSPLEGTERAKRATLFGGFGEGRRPLKPYLWRTAGGRTLVEIPVTTMPGLRTPFHLSYLLFLARRSKALMRFYLRAALRLCRATGTEPSFLLHPLDLLGAEDVPDLAFFPGMDLDAASKRAVFETVLGDLARSFTLVPVGEHARRALTRDLPVRAVPVAPARLELPR